MAALLSLGSLSDPETLELRYLESKLIGHQFSNSSKEAYYEARNSVRQLGIAIPPKLLSALETAAGWSGTVVDVLEERLDWLGWNESGEDLGLSEVFAQNDLDIDSGLGHLDALIFGISFACVGTGLDGEPNPLVTIQSPRDTTGRWDARGRRLTSALSQFVDPESRTVLEATLYLPDETIRVARANEGLPWTVIDRDAHKLGRVPVTPLVNRPRASRINGRSEITRAVRGYTDAAVRTLMGMEVNREFYSAPQRWAVGVSEDMFTKPDGTQVTGWEAIMGRLLVAPFDEDNPEASPSVGQFQQSTPGPYLDQVRGLSYLVAAEAAIPVSYFGFETDNPPSADAIRAMESRLVKRAERRQKTFGRAWLEVARLAMLMRNQGVPDTFDSDVSTKWQDAATPTRSAAADEAMKLVSAGILPADSSVTYDRIGLSETEQKQIEIDKRKARAAALVQALRANPAPAAADGTEQPAAAAQAAPAKQAAPAANAPAAKAK